MASNNQIQKTLIPITNQKSPSPSPSLSPSPSFSLSTEITSEDSLIDDDDLELSLGIRPINYRVCSPTPITKIPSPQPLSEEHSAFISKREVQALRRYEAKKKRDLKRKGSGGNWEGADVARDVSKIPRLNGSYWAPPSWWTWQNGNNSVSGGQNGNFGCSVKNVDESLSTGSSSGISDNNYQCFSAQGGNASSADAISHSSQTQSHSTPQSNTQTPTNSPPQSCPSHPEPRHQASSSTHDTSHLKTHLSSSSNHSDQVTNSSQPSSKSLVSTTSLEKSPSLTTQNSIPKDATGKPPRPNGQMKQQKPTLPEMPCVSVTGNGPNGKTITGILYKYTKTEVSIVCVCHGASFSPAGFVEHAGGVDVEHPLRHIRVVPFAL